MAEIFISYAQADRASQAQLAASGEGT